MLPKIIQILACGLWIFALPPLGFASNPGNSPGGCHLPPLKRVLKRHVTHGGLAIAHNGKPVFVSGEAHYIPASILKIATAHAALSILGPEHRFQTWVHAEKGWLHLKGWGDPMLVSEVWFDMAAQLARQGFFREVFKGLALDDFVFPKTQIDGKGRSLNPYDAALGALASNYNTLYLETTQGGLLRSAESQTPLVPLAVELGKNQRTGKVRINITAKGDHSLRYSAELAWHFMRDAGAQFSPKNIVWRRTPSPHRAPDWVYVSPHTLQNAVQAMLEYSNNVIANQLIWALALNQVPKNASGHPVQARPSFSQGVQVLQKHLQALGLNPKHYALVEGSGLSRKNRIHLRSMLRIVDAFYPWRNLLALAGSQKHQIRAKTGTLGGVQSLAGFLSPYRGKPRSFVLMLNQPTRVRQRVVKALLTACMAR